MRLALRRAYHVLGEYEKILSRLHKVKSHAEIFDDRYRLSQGLVYLASYFYAIEYCYALDLYPKPKKHVLSGFQMTI